MTTEDIQKYFEAYPTEHVIHITTDGQVFLQSNYNDAVNHQRQFTAKDGSKKLETISRKNLEAMLKKAKETEDNKAPDDTWKNPDIAAWLKKNGVDAKVNESKAKLLEKVAEVLKPKEDVVLTPEESWSDDQIVNWLAEQGEEVSAGETREQLNVKVQAVLANLADDQNKDNQ